MPSAANVSTCGPAGIGKAQHFADLVESFARRVVDGRAEPEIIPDPLHRDQLGVTAGDQQQQIGKREFVGEPRRQGMRFEMVDRQERLAACQGQGFRRGQPHHHPADETRPGRRGDPVEIRHVDPGPVERKLDEPVDDFDMGARRDLRHHPAIGRVLGDLAHDLVRENFARSTRLQLDDGGGGFVAGGFNPENAHDILWSFAARFPCKWIRWVKSIFGRRAIGIRRRHYLHL